MDEPGFTVPETPREWAEMADGDLMTLYRRMAADNHFADRNRVEMELNYRFLATLSSYASNARASARRIEVMTAGVILLTVILIVLTAVLVIGDFA